MTKWRIIENWKKLTRLGSFVNCVIWRMSWLENIFARWVLSLHCTQSACPRKKRWKFNWNRTHNFSMANESIEGSKFVYSIYCIIWELWIFKFSLHLKILQFYFYWIWSSSYNTWWAVNILIIFCHSLGHIFFVTEVFSQSL